MSFLTLYDRKNTSWKSSPVDYWGLDPPMPWSDIDLLEPLVMNEDDYGAPEDFLFLYGDSEYDQAEDQISNEGKEIHSAQENIKKETQEVVKIYDRETFFHDIGFYSDNTKATQNVSTPHHSNTGSVKFADSMTMNEMPMARSTHKE